MIVDNLTNATRYYTLHPLFEKAFHHIEKLDMESLEDGTTELVENRLKVAVVSTSMKPAADAKLETHEKFIDIQLPVTKAETFGWKSLSNLEESETGYDAQNDIEFFRDTPTAYVTLLPGEFVIFFPEDAHAPLVGEGATKKIIIKIAVD